MGILKTVLKINLKRLLDFQNFPVKSVFNILYILVAITFGIFLGLIINAFQEFDISIKEEQLFYALFIGIIAFTFLRGFFPSYNPIKNITKVIYPLSNFENFLINIFNELLKPYFIFTIITLLSFLVYLKGKYFYYFVSMIIGLIVAHLARRIVHILIEFKVKSLMFKGTFFGVGTLLIVAYFFIGTTINLFLIMLCSVLLIFANIKLYFPLKERRYFDNYLMVVDLIDIKYLKLFFRNELLRTTFIFQLVVHIPLLYADWQSYRDYGYHILKSDIIITFILSPISLFASYFNNIFGFSRSFWFTINKSQTSFINTIILIFKVLLIPLIIDMLINITYYYLSGNIKLFSAHYYFYCLIILFAFSIFFSFKYPRRVERAVINGANISPLVNVASLISVFLFIYLTAYFGNYLFIAAISISSIVFAISFYVYKNSKYKLFQVFYNT
ncbi:MAG: hypothetical protein AB1775_06275 [Bacteroidota bacterium]